MSVAHRGGILRRPLAPRPAAALIALRARLAGTGARWWVTGGVAAAFHGLDRRPGDVDAECVVADAAAVARALGIAMRTDEDGVVRSLRGGLVIAGVGVDVSAGLAIGGPGGRVEPDDDAVWAATREVWWAGGSLRVAPPGESLARALARGDAGRVARARAVAGPADEAYASARLG